ncbi:MAG: DUF11 domain-containing protein, partial [Defluviitaleaceae bacterium]|nr:DUF11 domain-containing protein [Defluviitaleaceae bacterium]
MKNKRLFRIIAFLLAALLVAGFFNVNTVIAANNGETSTSDDGGVSITKSADRSTADVDDYITYQIRVIYERDEEDPPLPTIEKDSIPPSGSYVGTGTLITYNIVVHNPTDTTMQNIVITDTLHDGLLFPPLMSSPAAMVNPPGSRTLMWNIPTLLPDEIFIIEIMVLAGELPAGQSSATIYNYATLTHDGRSIESNTVYHYMEAPPLLDAEKTASPTVLHSGIGDGYIFAGDIIRYTITVTNNTGQDRFQTFLVVDPTPLHTTFIPSSIASPFNAFGNYFNGEVTWAVNGIAAGETLTFQFSVMVDPNVPAGTLILNNAFVDGTTSEALTTRNIVANDTTQPNHTRLLNNTTMAGFGAAIRTQSTLATTVLIAPRAATTPAFPNATIIDVIDITRVQFVPNTLRVDGALTNNYNFDPLTGVLHVFVDVYANVPIYVTFDVLVIEAAAGQTIYNTATIREENNTLLATSNEATVVVSAPNNATEPTSTPSESTATEPTTTPTEPTTTPPEIITTQPTTTPAESTTTPSTTTPAESTTTQSATTPAPGSNPTSVPTTPSTTTPAE